LWRVRENEDGGRGKTERRKVKSGKWKWWGGREEREEKMERDKWETADENVRYEEFGDGKFAE